MKRMGDAKDIREGGDEAEDVEIFTIVDVCMLWLWHYKLVSNNRRHQLGWGEPRTVVLMVHTAGY